MPVNLKNLTVSYDGHPAIQQVSGAFADGSLTAIIGQNGAGKSTLIKAIDGLINNYNGAIETGLKPAEIAYLPQMHALDKTFAISVLDLVLMGYWKKTGVFSAISDQMLKDAEKALEMVGLRGFGGRWINSLSAGQFQRALFARTITQNAKLILLDEPFDSVDAKTTADLLAIIRSWNAQGKTVIAVLHDMRIVKENFPETLLLARECLAWGKTAEVLTESNLERARNMMENL